MKREREETKKVLANGGNNRGEEQKTTTAKTRILIINLIYLLTLRHLIISIITPIHLVAFKVVICSNLRTTTT